MSVNLLADPTFQTHATIAGDGILVDNGDGTFRIDLDGSGGSWVMLDLSAPLNPSHRYEVTFDASGQPTSLKGQLFQDGYNPQVSMGAANLFAAGTYDHTYTFSPPVGRLKVWNSVMSGHAFSVSNVSVVDLDA